MSILTNYTYPVCGIGVTFNEVPDHTTVFISIGQCLRRCEGCHSKDYLWVQNDNLLTPLFKIIKAIEKRVVAGCNAICVMGGDYNKGVTPDTLKHLLSELSDIAPVCLYTSGTKEEADIYLPYLKWLKTGSYEANLGGLSSPTTNQRFYEIKKHTSYNVKNSFVTDVNNTYEFIDMTYKFNGRSKEVVK